MRRWRRLLAKNRSTVRSRLRPITLEILELRVLLSGIWASYSNPAESHWIGSTLTDGNANNDGWGVARWTAPVDSRVSGARAEIVGMHETDDGYIVVGNTPDTAFIELYNDSHQFQGGLTNRYTTVNASLTPEGYWSGTFFVADDDTVWQFVNGAPMEGLSVAAGNEKITNLASDRNRGIYVSGITAIAGADNDLQWLRSFSYDWNPFLDMNEWRFGWERSITAERNEYSSEAGLDWAGNDGLYWAFSTTSNSISPTGSGADGVAIAFPYDYGTVVTQISSSGTYQEFYAYEHTEFVDMDIDVRSPSSPTAHLLLRDPDMGRYDLKGLHVVRYNTDTPSGTLLYSKDTPGDSSELIVSALRPGSVTIDYLERGFTRATGGIHVDDDGSRYISHSFPFHNDFQMKAGEPPAFYDAAGGRYSAPYVAKYYEDGTFAYLRQFAPGEYTMGATMRVFDVGDDGTIYAAVDGLEAFLGSEARTNLVPAGLGGEPAYLAPGSGFASSAYQEYHGAIYVLNAPSMTVDLPGGQMLEGNEAPYSFTFHQAENICDTRNTHDWVQRWAGYTLDWGDGDPEVVFSHDGTYFDANGEVMLKHTYLRPGTYWITVDVRDADWDRLDPAVNGFDETSGGVYPGLLRQKVIVNAVTPVTEEPDWGPDVNEGETYRMTLKGFTAATGTYQQWVDWGDGTVREYSNAGPKTHTYDGNGLYEIRVWLARLDRDLDYLIGTHDVYVTNVAPTIALTTNEPSGGYDEGDTATLTLGPVVDPGAGDKESVSRYRINWGDGSRDEYTRVEMAAAGRRLTHTYDADRDYTVAVYLQDQDSGSYYYDLACGTVAVAVRNVAPTVTATGSGTVNEGAAHTLNLTATDPGDDVTRYRVHWGDGQSSIYSYAATVTATHVYADDMPATITVDVEDQTAAGTQWHVGAASLDVAVANVVPAIELSGADEVDQGRWYTLSFSEVDDPGADTVYQWVVDWGDGSGAETFNYTTSPGQPNLPDQMHRYDLPADDVQISVSLRDEDGLHAADTITVDVNAIDAVLSLAGAYEVEKNKSHTLTMTEASGDALVGPVSGYRIVWGDGQESTYGMHPAGGQIWHAYAGEGDYTIEAYITDDSGELFCASREVTVTDVDQIDVDNFTGVIPTDHPYTLNVNILPDADGDPVAYYTVDWGDGSPIYQYTSSQVLTHTYAAVGPHRIQLDQHDGFGLAYEGAFVDTVLVEQNVAPVTTRAIKTQVTLEDELFEFTVPADVFWDANGNEWLTYAAAGLPEEALPGWLRFDQLTRTLQGVPTNDEVGTHAVTVTATDAGGLGTEVTFDIVVQNVNDAPELINGLPTQQMNEDETWQFTVPGDTFYDCDNAYMNYAVWMADDTRLPSWLHFNYAARTFTGTPANAQVGTYHLIVRATDQDGLSAEAPLQLTVNNVNDAPRVMAPIADQTLVAGQTYTINVADGVFEDVDQGDVLTLEVRRGDGSALPNWISYNAFSREITFAPQFAHAGSSVEIVVLAKDRSGAAAVDMFNVEPTYYLQDVVTAELLNTAGLDGNPDPAILGRYLRGISIPGDMEIRLNDVGNQLVDEMIITVGTDRWVDDDGSDGWTYNCNMGLFSHDTAVNVSVYDYETSQMASILDGMIDIHQLPGWIKADNVEYEIVFEQNTDDPERSEYAVRAYKSIIDFTVRRNRGSSSAFDMFMSDLTTGLRSGIYYDFTTNLLGQADNSKPIFSVKFMTLGIPLINMELESGMSFKYSSTKSKDSSGNKANEKKMGISTGPFTFTLAMPGSTPMPDGGSGKKISRTWWVEGHIYGTQLINDDLSWDTNVVNIGLEVGAGVDLIYEGQTVVAGVPIVYEVGVGIAAALGVDFYVGKEAEDVVLKAAAIVPSLEVHAWGEAGVGTSDFKAAAIRLTPAVHQAFAFEWERGEGWTIDMPGSVDLTLVIYTEVDLLVGKATVEWFKHSWELATWNLGTFHLGDSDGQSYSGTIPYNGMNGLNTEDLGDNSCIVYVRNGSLVSAEQTDAGNWSTPMSIVNSTRPQHSPSTASAGNQVHVVYVQTDLPAGQINLSDQQRLRQAQQIYWVHQNGNVWQPAQAITSDDYYNTDPVITVREDGLQAVALWRRAEVTADGDVLEHTMEICYAAWNGTNWSAPELLTNNDYVDTTPSIVADGHGLFVATWLADTDRDHHTQAIMSAVWDYDRWRYRTTIADDGLYHHEWVGAIRDKNGKVEIYWTGMDYGYFLRTREYSDGLYGDVDTVLAHQALITDPSLSMADNGRITVTYVGRGDGEMQIYAVSHNSPWTTPVQLTSVGGFYQNPYLVFDADGGMTIIVTDMLLDEDNPEAGAATGDTFRSSQLDDVEALFGCSVTGVLFHDGNINGVFDADEDPLAGWQVYIDADDSGTWGEGEAAAFTDGNGAYTFENPTAGYDAMVRPVLPDGWYDTAAYGPFDVLTGCNITDAHVGVAENSLPAPALPSPAAGDDSALDVGIGTLLADRTVVAGLPVELDLTGSFVDDDGHLLTYTVTLADGTPLLPWLSFDEDNLRLTGTPGPGDLAAYPIAVTASDSYGGQATLAFTLTVVGPEEVLRLEEGVLNVFGSDAADQFVLVGDEQTFTVGVNDLENTYEWDALTGVVICGYGGEDALTVSGPMPLSRRVVARGEGSGTIGAGDDRIDWMNIKELDFTDLSADDSVVLHDTESSDSFNAGPGGAEAAFASGVNYRFQGNASISMHFSHGSGDSAVLNDGPGDEVLTGTLETGAVTLTGMGWSRQVVNFDALQVELTQGFDSATIGTLTADEHHYTIDWGDGSPEETITRTSQIDRYRDGNNATSYSITVQNDSRPVTSATVLAVLEGLNRVAEETAYTLSVTPSQSSLPYIPTWHVDWNGQAPTIYDASFTLDHNYVQDGSYVIQLMLDGAGVERSIVVDNLAPTVVPPEPQLVYIDTTVVLDLDDVFTDVSADEPLGFAQPVLVDAAGAVLNDGALPDWAQWDAADHTLHLTPDVAAFTTDANVRFLMAAYDGVEAVSTIWPVTLINQQTGGSTGSVTYYEPDGDCVRISAVNIGGINATGLENGVLDTLQISDTGAGSLLRIAVQPGAAGDGLATIDRLAVDGSLSTLMAEAVLFQEVSVQGNVGVALLGDVADADFSIAGDVTMFLARSVTGGTLEAQGIGTLRTTQGSLDTQLLLGAPGISLLHSATHVGGAITSAGRIGSLITPGDLTADIDAASVGSASIGGHLTGNVRVAADAGLWSVQGDVHGLLAFEQMRLLSVGGDVAGTVQAGLQLTGAGNPDDINSDHAGRIDVLLTRGSFSGVLYGLGGLVSVGSVEGEPFAGDLIDHLLIRNT